MLCYSTANIHSDSLRKWSQMFSLVRIFLFLCANARSENFAVVGCDSNINMFDFMIHRYMLTFNFHQIHNIN